VTDVAARRPWLRRAIALEYFSVAWMVGEGTAGVLSGVAAQSLALEVFALDSLIEVISALVVLWRMRLELRMGASREGGARTKTADRRAAFVVAACLLALAAYILAGVVDRVRTRAVPSPSIVGFIVAIAAIVVMPGLWRSKQRTGERLHSEALQEDGVGNLVCSWMAVILLLGLVAARVGWWWADPAASLALGVFVAREGWEAWHHARGVHRD
jgi:divalent metal cation (Fe/Co/Zn/Cd) transporter